jgi:hypothetical protein
MEHLMPLMKNTGSLIRRLSGGAALLWICWSYGGTADMEKGARESFPPDPPPGSYVRPVIEKAGESPGTGENRAVLVLHFAEAFNAPLVRSLEGNLLPGSVEILQVGIACDPNGNQVLDDGETVAHYATPDETGAFHFDHLSIVPEDNRTWLILGCAPPGTETDRTFSVAFREGAVCRVQRTRPGSCAAV